MRVLNTLQGCLVDADPARQGQARRRRAVSLGVSLGLQGLMLGAIVVAPLLLTAKDPRLEWRTVVPAPPYGSSPPKAAAEERGRAHLPAKPMPSSQDVIFTPPNIPQHIADGEAATQVTGKPGDGKSQDGGIPGGHDRGLIPGFGERGPAWIPLDPPPPATPEQTKRMRVHTSLSEAMLVHRVQPRYPELARRVRLETIVELRAVISREGRVQELEVVSGNPLFYEETLRAVQQWRYRPTLLNGEPVEVETRIRVVFQLR